MRQCLRSLFAYKISSLQVWWLCGWALRWRSILILLSRSGSRGCCGLTSVVLPIGVDDLSAGGSRTVEMCVNQPPRAFSRTHVAVNPSLERILLFQELCKSINPGVHRHRRRRGVGPGEI